MVNAEFAALLLLLLHIAANKSIKKFEKTNVKHCFGLVSETFRLDKIETIQKS